MPPTAFFLCVAWTLTPFALAAPLFAVHPTEAIVSQSLGVAGISAMALAQFLATRPRWLEGPFHGLDRMYVAHKWLGVSALALVFLHDSTIAKIDGLGRATAFSEQAEELGDLALNGLLALIAASLLTIIPYRWWRYSHKAIGAFFAIGAVHALGVERPFDLTDPLGVWLVATAAIGVASWLYTLLPFGLPSRRRAYEVASVERSGDALAVELQPLGRPYRSRPGQFAFIAFDDAPGREAHPFTLSAAPRDDGRLRATIKGLGDDTARFPDALRSGGRARVSPPFGRFILDDRDVPQIWIGAGVGATPFAAWTGALASGPAAKGAPIDLFLCARRRSSIPHLDAFEAAAAAHPRLRLHIVETASDGRLSAEGVLTAADASIVDARVAYCGPEALGDALERGLRERGLPRGRFRREAFRIRAGLGFPPDRWTAWASARIRRAIGGSAR